MTINIAAFDKAEVLAALYNAARQQGVGLLNPRGAHGMTVEQARVEIAQNPSLYFDYLRGRVMKINLKHDKLDERLYDRDNGTGAAYYALSPLLLKWVQSTPLTMKEPERRPEDG